MINMENIFMEKLEKKDSLTAAILYGANLGIRTAPIGNGADTLEEHLKKLRCVGMMLLGEMEETEDCLKLHNVLVNKMCTLTKTFIATPKTNFALVETIFEAPKKFLCTYNTKHDVIQTIKLQSEMLIFVLIGVYSAESKYASELKEVETHGKKKKFFKMGIFEESR